MNHYKDRNPAELTPEVYDLAAKLYAENTQGNYPEQLMQAEPENQIPPEFIQQAYAQIQAQQIQAATPAQLYQPKQRKGLLVSLAAVLTGAALLAGIGIYLALKSVEQTPIAQIEPAVAPVDTCQPNEPAQDLGGTNLAGRDLRGMNLCNADLGGANLTKANLEGVDLRGADLSGVNLSNAKLSDADLSDADLSGADLANADLSNTNLSNADLSGANLSHANLNGSDLNGAVLTGADLAGATMPNDVNSQ